MRLPLLPTNRNHLLAVALGAITLQANAQTATNFNCTDCHNIQHDLFAELDAGKVIVITWVMPCASCTGPALTTYNVVQSYQASDSGRVFMYLCDDYANTSCTALNTWKSTIGLANAVDFSNAAIHMNDYGGSGMPKIVVLGGSNHTVFYTADNTVDATALQNAINAALAVTGIDEQNELAAGFSVHPVPATDEARITFNLPQTAPVEVGLYDISGKLAKNIHSGILSRGQHSNVLHTQDLPAGNYVLRITDGKQRATLNLPIIH